MEKYHHPSCRAHMESVLRVVLIISIALGAFIDGVFILKGEPKTALEAFLGI